MDESFTKRSITHISKCLFDLLNQSAIKRYLTILEDINIVHILLHGPLL